MADRIDAPLPADAVAVEFGAGRDDVELLEEIPTTVDVLEHVAGVTSEASLTSVTSAHFNMMLVYVSAMGITQLADRVEGRVSAVVLNKNGSVRAVGDSADTQAGDVNGNAGFSSALKLKEWLKVWNGLTG